jgi:hypothetical protein
MSQTKTEGACMDGLDSDFKRRGRVKRYTMVIEPVAHPEARRKLVVGARDDGDADDQASDHAAAELPYPCTIAITKIEEISADARRELKLPLRSSQDGAELLISPTERKGSVNPLPPAAAHGPRSLRVSRRDRWAKKKPRRSGASVRRKPVRHLSRFCRLRAVVLSQIVRLNCRP